MKDQNQNINRNCGGMIILVIKADTFFWEEQSLLLNRLKSLIMTNMLE